MCESLGVKGRVVDAPLACNLGFMTTATPRWLSDPVAYAERGENPTGLRRMESGYGEMGLAQFLLGYCLLLAVPKAPRVGDMPRQPRVRFFVDTALLDIVVTRSCGAC